MASCKSVKNLPLLHIIINLVSDLDQRKINKLHPLGRHLVRALLPHAFRIVRVVLVAKVVDVGRAAVAEAQLVVAAGVAPIERPAPVVAVAARLVHGGHAGGQGGVGGLVGHVGGIKRDRVGGVAAGGQVVRARLFGVELARVAGVALE